MSRADIYLSEVTSGARRLCNSSCSEKKCKSNPNCTFKLGYKNKIPLSQIKHVCDHCDQDCVKKPVNIGK